MKRILSLFLVFTVAYLTGCSSGKKAFEHGNYYEAVLKSVQRLRQKPDHSKSIEALQNAYPLALEVLESQATNAVASDAPYKYKSAIASYDQVNQMYEQIRQCPACLKVIRSPKNYYSEIGPLKEKAADESYNAGINALMKGTRNDAKQAYFNFVDAQSFVSGYKDVVEYLDKAKWEATLKVVVEQIPVPSRYNLSGSFFQNKVEEYLHSNYPDKGFIKFYTDQEAKTVKLPQADHLLRIQFEDFSVGNINLKEKEETVTRDSVRVGETKLEGKVIPVYNTVKAKLTTYRKEVTSSGLLSMVIVDGKTSGILSTKKFNGQYAWVSSWGRFNGDERALTEQQKTLCKQKEGQPPQNQDLFLEFTKPIFDQLTPAIKNFYASY
jgi:hypothetical protein